jgi:hypothetical protein
MNLIKTMLASVLFLVANNAFAISLQDLQVRELDKIAVNSYVDYNDATLMNVKYTGSEATALILIGPASLAIQAPTGTSLVSTITLTDAAYNTMGEVCDYLNTQTGIVCKLTGAKRDDLSILMWNTAALLSSGSSIAGNGGYSVLIGTGSAVADESQSEMNRIGITPQPGRRVVLKYCNATNDGTGVAAVYGKLAKYDGVSDGVSRDDTTLAASIATANDTAKVVGNIYGGNWLEFAKNEHVVIVSGTVLGTGGTAQTNTSSLECFWDEK